MMKSNYENSIVPEKKKKVIDLGKIEQDWEYTQDKRLDAVLKCCKYLKWKNTNITE